jgi:hypothetical protein
MEHSISLPVTVIVIAYYNKIVDADFEKYIDMAFA